MYEHLCQVVNYNPYFNSDSEQGREFQIKDHPQHILLSLEIQ